MAMETVGGAAWSGKVRIVVYDETGAAGEPTVLPNLVVDDGLNLFRDGLRGARNDLQIRYIALGADSTAPAASDSALGDERFRKFLAQQSSGGTGETKSTFYIAPQEANDFTIEELGFYAGDASDTADSGTLVARVLYSRAKTASEALQIERSDQIKAA